MRWEQMTPSDDVGAAGWIRDGMQGFAVNVGSIIPHGFAAYARIFHPARARPDVEVPWSEVAASTGRTVHPEMQFHAIATAAVGREEAPAPWEFEPKLGVLSPGQAAALATILSRHTTTPDRCWFCLWEGYGYIRGTPAIRAFWKEGAPRTPPPSPRPRPKLAPTRVHLPHRDYVLFTGSVTDAEGWEDGPNLWWPDDHAWCVASEIDFPYTYVGGSQGLINELLDGPRLEALPATLDDKVTYDGDRVNA